MSRPWHDLNSYETLANIALARRHDLYPLEATPFRRMLKSRLLTLGF